MSAIPNSSYRRDIDGLRGIAVLLVLFFHFWDSVIPGGFVGVDVFFVISGYLISNILFADLRENRFSIARFYERRIKRVFPALVTVIAASLVLGWLLLFPFEFQVLGKHIVACATFSSNILLWFETDYFAEAADHTPLLHLWSLAVEEQFYLGFPFVLWFIVRRQWPTTRILGVITFLSFAMCVYATYRHPTAAYYLPVTRIWEILVGCLLASLEQDAKTAGPSRLLSSLIRSRANVVVANGSSLIGLSLVMGSAFLLGDGYAFPGAWALIPVLGAAFLIFAGPDASINRWLVGHRVLVWIGLISYPLYLWHWPLISFTRIFHTGEPSGVIKTGLILLSFILAFLTCRLIEQPIRFGRNADSKPILGLSVSMVALLLLGVLVIPAVIPSRSGLTPAGQAVNDAVKDRDYPFPDNFKRHEGFFKDAQLNTQASGGTVLFIGDSHVQHLWPRIELILDQNPAKSRPVTLLTAGGSPTLPNVNRLVPGFECDDFFDFALKEAAKPEVATVVFSCFWESYFIGCYPDGEPELLYDVDDPAKSPLRLGTPAADKVFDEFGEAIARLVGQGKEVVVLLSTPASSALDPSESPRFGHEPDSAMRIERGDLANHLKPLRERLIPLVTRNGGRIIDPKPYLLRDGYYRGKTQDGRFKYMDDDHMRPFFVRERATFIDALILKS